MPVAVRGMSHIFEDQLPTHWRTIARVSNDWCETPGSNPQTVVEFRGCGFTHSFGQVATANPGVQTRDCGCHGGAWVQF